MDNFTTLQEFHIPIMEACLAAVSTARLLSIRIRNRFPGRDLPNPWSNPCVRNDDETFPMSIYCYAFVCMKVCCVFVVCSSLLTQRFRFHMQLKEYVVVQG